MGLLSTTALCALKQFKTLTTCNVPNDVYRSVYVDSSNSSTDKTNVINNQQGKIGIIGFNTVNQLMTTSETMQPEPSPQPSTNLRWNQIRVSNLDTGQRQFAITQKYKCQYQ